MTPNGVIFLSFLSGSAMFSTLNKTTVQFECTLSSSSHLLGDTAHICANSFKLLPSPVAPASETNF